MKKIFKLVVETKPDEYESKTVIATSRRAIKGDFINVEDVTPEIDLRSVKAALEAFTFEPQQIELIIETLKG